MPVGLDRGELATHQGVERFERGFAVDQGLILGVHDVVHPWLSDRVRGARVGHFC